MVLALRFRIRLDLQLTSRNLPLGLKRWVVEYTPRNRAVFAVSGPRHQGFHPMREVVPICLDGHAQHVIFKPEDEAAGHQILVILQGKWSFSGLCLWVYRPSASLCRGGDYHLRTAPIAFLSAVSGSPRSRGCPTLKITSVLARSLGLRLTYTKSNGRNVQCPHLRCTPKKQRPSKARQQ